VIRIIFEVIGGLKPSWIFYLRKTILGLVAQLIIGLGVEPGIW
jgi:hypothetical protein